MILVLLSENHTIFLEIYLEISRYSRLLSVPFLLSLFRLIDYHFFWFPLPDEELSIQFPLKVLLHTCHLNCSIIYSIRTISTCAFHVSLLFLQLNVDPEDLIPKLPKPRDLHPFPTSENLVRFCATRLFTTKQIKKFHA